MNILRSHYPERVSALDFKDAAALRFGRSDIFFVYCDNFDIKSNHFGPVTPKQLKSFEKLDKRVIKCKNVLIKSYIAMTRRA